MDIYHHRGALRHTLAALQNGSLAVGFLGGSITDARPECSWPEPVIAWLVETYPGVRIEVENHAIGATGSDVAVLHTAQTLIDRGCQLVFVEYAVNDNDVPAQRRMRSREGLLRKLLAGAGRDVVLTYTYLQSMYAGMMADRVPASIADFEVLAEHYALGSVWMARHAMDEVMKGRMRWEEWLPDGLHPQARGSLSYGQSVIAFLDQELRIAPGTRPIPAGPDLPPPLDPGNWEHAYRLPLTSAIAEGPWTLRNWPRFAWLDHVLHTAAVGARLTIPFDGCGLYLGFDFGLTSAEFRYRIDGGPWKDSGRDRPAWCPPDGWYRVFEAAAGLPPGGHTFEMEVVHGNTAGDSPLADRYAGTNIRLGMIGVIPG